MSLEFPKNEYPAYLSRLAENKSIFTTRISDEVRKYSLNETYDSPFGKLKVISIKHFSTLKEHPFFDELTETQIEEIEKYTDERGIDLLELRLIK